MDRINEGTPVLVSCICAEPGDMDNRVFVDRKWLGLEIVPSSTSFWVDTNEANVHVEGIHWCKSSRDLDSVQIQ